MPTYISGEGKPFRPEMLIWMANSGEVLGQPETICLSMREPAHLDGEFWRSSGP